MRRIIILTVTVLGVTSCVTTKKYNSMEAQSLRYEAEMMEAKDRADVLEKNYAHLEGRKAALRTERDRLYSDYEKLLEDGSAEASRMLRQLEENTRELDMRARKVDELEEALRAREDALRDIRGKVSDALLGFEGKGLSISTRDGKVYVSMDDKLLFKSGSFNIDPRGAEAVRDLGNVLAANPDINIMVEGHTDDVPYKGSGQLQDNLDLSVKRATTVTRLLLENKGIAPERIISAGRGESLPVDNAKTPEARQKNRRTEIILTPKLDELMQMTE